MTEAAPRKRLVDRVTARTVDEAEVVASVLLAIAVAHWLGAANVYWAAFAGYMVMRGHAGETLVRGLLRITGTGAGGLLALAAAPFLGWWPAAAAALFLVGGGALYAAITAKRSYAWLFFGLTFAMVVLDKLAHPDVALARFVETRVLETVAGTLACLAVSLASTLTLRRIWPATPSPRPAALGWHPEAARHALQAATALALLVGLSAWLHLPALSQAAIGIMAVMLVPADSIGASGLMPVSRRLVQRFLGCLAGAALAALILFVAQGSPPLLILGTILGVVIGRHLENGDHAHRYVGTQFALAILIVLVPDSYADAEIRPALMRLAGVLIGFAVLEPVLLAWHWIAPSRQVAVRSKDDAPGDI
ncbi:FUSC family protein [Sphingomonas kyeonggiensis]|uniref:Putative membrane protein YccC n=1 Tax=Sphingomonas kyeonggiensis TaxID=1268553 RepID=A0A7W6JV70_9SPHN|nr:FUSC family protein [Sphingomonas kyeonggiensis]MBB4100143.1 putative membrane protein YccC [Sphingomonas kyeonggiensis]